MKIKVLLADDHPIVRSGIRNELTRHADIEVIGEAVDGDEALQLVQAERPDVLLLDISMPGMSAAQVVRELQMTPGPPHVLVLSAYGDIATVLRMLEAGVMGYLLKDEEPSKIVEGVRAVAQGETWLCATVAESLVGHTVRDEQRPEEILTERELQVLRLMAQGKDNRRIAEELCISERTVKFHVGHIYDKLEVDSRVQAVLWAIQWKVAEN